MQMNRELAIQMLKTRGIDGRLSGYTDGYTELYDYCLQILENCDEDCISRRAIIGKCEDTAKATSESGEINTGFIMALDFIADYAKHMPSIEPERKVGHWEYTQYDNKPGVGNWHCSECKDIVVECLNKIAEGRIPRYKYCSNCGCRMIDPQEGEEGADECNL